MLFGFVFPVNNNRRDGIGRNRPKYHYFILKLKSKTQRVSIYLVCEFTTDLLFNCHMYLSEFYIHVSFIYSHSTYIDINGN